MANIKTTEKKNKVAVNGYAHRGVNRKNSTKVF